MVTNQAKLKTRLSVDARQCLLDGARCPTFPLPGEAEFPGPPAMPGGLLRLELCLSAFVIDLQEITNIIKSDVGLTVQLLRLAAREIAASPVGVLSISQIVVHAGVGNLASLAAHTHILPDYLRNGARLSVCERFWMRCRLAALVAESLAPQCSGVDPEEAYLAGLLYHVGSLPRLLGWASPGADRADFRRIGHRMAQAWELPRVLVDVIGNNREACCTGESRDLLEIAKTAAAAVSRLELLAARELADQVRVRCGWSESAAIRDSNAEPF
jgi:HD-like signal output (HDOD) protein